MTKKNEEKENIDIVLGFIRGLKELEDYHTEYIGKCAAKLYYALEEGTL